MKLRTKLTIVAAAAIVGGLGFATAKGYPAVFSATDTSTVQTQPQDTTSLTSTPADSSTPVDTATPTSSDSGTSQTATQQPAAQPQPKPQPKPATVYSDQPSAATPCRLRTENTYTNDCSATPQQPAQTTQSTQNTTAPTDSTTPVSNTNNTVSNPNQP